MNIVKHQQHVQGDKGQLVHSHIIHAQSLLAKDLHHEAQYLLGIIIYTCVLYTLLEYGLVECIFMFFRAILKTLRTITRIIKSSSRSSQMARNQG